MAIGSCIDYNKHFFDKVAERWDQMRKEDAAKIRSMVKLSGLKAGENVLDAGCGTGVLLPYLKEVVEEGHITGLDFSCKMLAQAVKKYRSLGGISFVNCDFINYVPHHPYTTVFCLNFYPHVSDKTQFFMHLRSLIEPGGSAIIMHDMSRAEVNSAHSDATEVKADSLLEAKVMAALLEETGFKIENLIDNEEMYFIKAVKQ